MSRFSGPQGKGALRRHREDKRLEAADRRAAREHAVLAERDPARQLLTEIFAEPDDEGSAT
ncbi:hypothetical protein [Jiangella asiatica]|uniref:Uncharacterized protein n=1 Tax=Jiangella asiatica TaxID=2530372 RepID=A0A4R5CVF1_9ACTN|nr:hypothetical protein [Jiangella asiatica]TDE03430.1 hypothetical protein E1269_20545 [Jiangella asiatica]